MPMSKVALITGVTGQDGAYLARFLLGKGYTVIGTSRDAQAAGYRNLDLLGIREKVSVDSMALRDFRSVLSVITKVNPDEIYHLAGQSSVSLSFEQPAETLESISVGTLNLLEAIRFAGRSVRVYSACSSECYGNTDDAAASEKTPFHPRSPYAVAKAAAFWQVANYREAYGLHACSGILFNHESPLRQERFVTQKIIRAAIRISRGSDEGLILGNLDVERDWGWAPEYVEAMWKMLQQTVPEDFVVATGQTNSLRDFVAEAFTSMGLDWRDHVTSDVDSLSRPTDIRISRSDPTYAAERLGWRARFKMSDVVRMMLAAAQESPDHGEAACENKI